MNDSTYPSRVDAWLIMLLLLSIGIMLYTAQTLYSHSPRESLFVLALLAGLVDITAVEPSSSPWSAPALSLRKVKISFAGRFQLVSLRDREQFIVELRERVRAARPGT